MSEEIPVLLADTRWNAILGKEPLCGPSYIWSQYYEVTNETEWSLLERGHLHAPEG